MNKLKRIMAAMLAVLLALLCLTGCGKKNKVEQYRATLNTYVEEIVKMDDDLEDAVGDVMAAIKAGDVNAYNEAMTKVKSLSASLTEKYRAIANTEPPEEYKTQQVLMQQHVVSLEKMINNAIELYTLAGNELNGGLSETDVERIGALQTEITMLQPAVESFDSVLNDVLGVSEKESSGK